MKKNIYFILTGVAALHVIALGSLVMSGGCKNTVMDDRSYIPAPPQKTPVAPVTFTAPAKTQQKKSTSARPLYKPLETRSYTAPVSSPVAPVSGGTYTLKAGDTVSAIAAANGVSLAAMMQANNLTNDSARKLRVGQKLVIPGKATANSNSKISTPIKKVVSNSKPKISSDGKYVVVSGDNIPKIANKLGVKAIDLQKANNLSDEATRRLQIGQKLIIPGKTVVAKSVDTVSTPATKKEVTTPVTPKEEVKADIENVLNDIEKTAPATETAAETTAEPKTVFLDITEDTTIDKLASEHGVTVDSIRSQNPTIAADGTIKVGDIIIIEKK